MIPIDLLIALAVGVWYLVVSVIVFRHIRKQTQLLEIIARKIK